MPWNRFVVQTEGTNCGNLDPASYEFLCKLRQLSIYNYTFNRTAHSKIRCSEAPMRATADHSHAQRIEGHYEKPIFPLLTRPRPKTNQQLESYFFLLHFATDRPTSRNSRFPNIRSEPHAEQHREDGSPTTMYLRRSCTLGALLLIDQSEEAGSWLKSFYSVRRRINLTRTRPTFSRSDYSRSRAYRSSVGALLEL